MYMYVHTQNAHLVACWRRGKLYVNVGAGGPPCLGLRNTSAPRVELEARQEAGLEARQVGLLHLTQGRLRPYARKAATLRI